MMKRELKQIFGAVLLSTALLCGCQGEKAAATGTEKTTEAETTVPETTVPETTAEETVETQEYVTEDSTYSVILPAGMELTDMRLGQNISMLLLDGEDSGMKLQVVSVGIGKMSMPPNSGEINSLEDYAEYMEKLMGGDGSMKMIWDSEEETEMEGMERSLAKSGKITQGTASSKARACYGETERAYYGAILMGKGEDLDNGQAVLLFKELELARAQTTKNYILAMTSVLDSLNGANMMETFKGLHDVAGDSKKNVDTIKQKEALAAQVLEESWNITDRDSLYEMKEGLMNEGHNQEALSLLTKDGISAEMTREEAAQKLKDNGADDETLIYMMAAFDARAEFGENAIKAWDLSRAATIMEIGYSAGYCTYEEALDGALEAAVLAQQTFGSWEEFNRSYLYGYSYWNEEALDDPDSEAYERKTVMETFEAQKNGPFSVDWNMELTKEW